MENKNKTSPLPVPALSAGGEILTKSRSETDGSSPAGDEVSSYAYRTEKTYSDWIIRYIKYHGTIKHPRDMSKPEIEAFLSHLTVDRDVSASIQRQAHNAIIFLYDQVINIPVSEVSDDGKFLSLFSLLFLLKEWQYQYQM